MRAGFAPRFAIEAGFLVLLGVGAGLADLRTSVIVALLAGGWLLVSLIELSVWRAEERPVAPVLPLPEPQHDPEPEIGWPADEQLVEPEETDEPYPLRAGAGDAPSDEVEAYTRVLSGDTQAGPPDENAE
jgi:hypothetical protein